MTVTIRLSTTLRGYVTDYSPSSGLEMKLEDRLTVAELAKKLGLPCNEIKIVMVNGRHASLEQTLSDGDRIGFFPAVGGG